MDIQFSTSDKSDAMKRVRRALPNATDGFVEFIGQKVANGIIRIGDPFMYNGMAPIYPTEKTTPQDQAEITQRCVNKQNRPSEPAPKPSKI